MNKSPQNQTAQKPKANIGQKKIKEPLSLDLSNIDQNPPQPPIEPEDQHVPDIR